MYALSAGMISPPAMAAAPGAVAAGRPKPAPMIGNIPVNLTSSRRDSLDMRAPFYGLFELISHDHAAFHHELHTFHLGNIRERISRDRDNVGELAFLDAADLAFPAIIQHARGGQISCLKRLHRAHTPFG